MKKVIYFIFSFFLLTNIINAETVTINSKSNIDAGSEFAVEINVDGTNIQGLNAKLTYDKNKLELLSFKVGSSFNTADVDSKIVVEGSNPNTGKVTAITLNFKAKSDFKSGNSTEITLSEIELGQVNNTNGKYSFKTLTASNVTHKVTVNVPKSTVNTLSTIKINSKDIDSFSASTTNYTVNNITDASIELTAVATDSKATVTGTGTKTLSYGKNTFTITVTSESGSKKTYTVIVNRIDNRNSNNYLSKLTLSEGTIKFSKNTTTYKVILEHDVESIKIEATAEAETSKITGTGTKTLKDYTNKFTVVVTAENETKKTYTINVIRKDENGNVGKLSTDNTLSNLSIKGYSIDFNSKTTEYSINVENDVTQVEVSATANNKNATLEIDTDKISDNLKVGENSIIIKVTSESGEEKTYTIKVNRKDDESVVTIDNLEKALKNSKKDTIEVEIKDDNNKLSSNLIKTFNDSKKTLIIKKYINDKLMYSWTIKNAFDSNIEFNSLIEFVDNNTLLDKTNYSEGIYLKYSYEGKLPKGTILKIYVGDKYKDGTKVSLYYFNKDNIELIKSDLIVKDGYVTYELDHCSDYVITRADLVVDNLSEEDDDSSISVPLLIICIIEGIAVIVFIILFLKSKNKKEETSNKENNFIETTVEPINTDTVTQEVQTQSTLISSTPAFESNMSFENTVQTVEPVSTETFTQEVPVEPSFVSSTPAFESNMSFENTVQSVEPVSTETFIQEVPVESVSTVEVNTETIPDFVNDANVEFNFTSNDNTSFEAMQNEFKQNDVVESNNNFANDNNVDFNFNSNNDELVSDDSVEFNFTSSSGDSFSSLQDEFKYSSSNEATSTEEKKVEKSSKKEKNTTSNDEILSVEDAIKALEGLKPVVDISSER